MAVPPGGEHGLDVEQQVPQLHERSDALPRPAGVGDAGDVHQKQLVVEALHPAGVRAGAPGQRPPHGVARHDGEVVP